MRDRNLVRATFLGEARHTEAKKKASFHRAESGRIFALFASKTCGSLGDACPPPEKAFWFPTFPPLISLRLNGLVYVTPRLPRFDSLNIPTDPFERRGFTPNVTAKPVPMSRVSRRRGLVLNGKENLEEEVECIENILYLSRDTEKLVAVGRIVGEYFTATWEDRFVCNEFGKIKKRKK